MSQKVQYTVEVLKTGSGGEQAAAELQNVATAATAASKAGANLNHVYDPAPFKKTGDAAGHVANQFKQLNQTATTTRQGMNALRGVVTIVGLQAFPQLTTAVMAGTSALQGVRGVSLLTGASLGAVGVAVVAAAGAVAVGTAAWSAYTAGVNEAIAADSRMAQQGSLSQRLRQLITENEKRLPKGRADELRAMLHNASPAELPGAQAEVRDALSPVLQTKAEQAGFKKLGDLHAQIHVERMSALDRERAKIEDTYNLEVARILELTKGAQITEDFQQRQFVLNDARLKKEEQLAALENRRWDEMARRSVAQFADEDRYFAEQDRQHQARLQWEDEYNQKVMQGLTRKRTELTALEQLGQQVGQNLANGLGTALVNSFEQGGDAFKNFAAQFFKLTAEMIAQAAILAALQAALGGTKVGAILGFTKKAAQGGMFPRMMAAGGIAGVSAVSSATYFPRYNVVAGEAGAEMMAVLARPRMMEVGGMQAVVGNAAGNRLAITSADALSQRGQGGAIDIRVTMEPGLKAEIINNSVQGAVVRVTQDISRHTRLREVVKGASS